VHSDVGTETSSCSTTMFCALSVLLPRDVSRLVARMQQFVVKVQKHSRSATINAKVQHFRGGKVQLSDCR